MSKITSKIKLPILVFLFVFAMLSMVQIKVETKMLLLERLFAHGGWIEIILLASYGSVVAWFMQDINRAPKWRIHTWTIFTIWFFLQLFIGIFISDIFLLTGKLHLPIPAMIIGGPLYRGQISFMTVLFLSTILLSGPSWCCHLCYFGAIDGLLSRNKVAKASTIAKNKMVYKISIVLIVISIAIFFRWMNVQPLYATLAGLTFGVFGLAIILFISRRKNKMVHCTIYCPVGTVVNFLSKVSPFRLRIDKSCTSCMKCTPVCRYDALNLVNIRDKKPGLTCTLCGDCLSSCHANSFRYKFLGLNPVVARKVYLFITISLHAIFMGMGRI